jgi:hypothetical protein
MSVKDLTVEDVNRMIGENVTPVKQKATGMIGKLSFAPSKVNNLVKKVFTKLFSFIWRLLCMPFMPVVNAWRKS